MILTTCCFITAGLYPGVSENPIEELRSSVQATLLAFLCLWSATYFVHDLTSSRLTFLFGCLFSVVLVPSSRASARSFFASRDWWGCPVAILGYGTTGKRIEEILNRNPQIGLKVVAALDDNPTQYLEADTKLIRGPLSRCLEITRQHSISYAIVCMPSLSRNELLRLLDRYGQCFGHVMVIPDLIGMSSVGIRVREMRGIIGLEVTRQLLRPSAKIAKRLLDLAITAALLPIALPMVLACAALIKLESRGAVLFANERIGLGGRKFKAWKLRTMVVNGDQVLREYFEKHPLEQFTFLRTQKLRNDPRITKVGRILRKTSIDELPQLWNVFKGEMSVVGPRPFLECQIEMYGRSFELYKLVRPGITGPLAGFRQKQAPFLGTRPAGRVLHPELVGVDGYLYPGPHVRRCPYRPRRILNAGFEAMSLTMFSRAFRSAWLATVLLTTIVELTPFHSEGMPRYVFYSWKAFKCLLFLALGWETPLTFWKSNTLTNGLLLGFISAGAIECIQGLVVGHSFSPSNFCQRC